MPAKVIWHSDRRPAYPAMGMSESPTMASPPDPVEAEQVSGRDNRCEEDRADDRPRAEQCGTGPGGTERELPAPELPMAAKTGLGQQQERREEDDRRNGVRESLDVGVLRKVGHGVGDS